MGEAINTQSNQINEGQISAEYLETHPLIYTQEMFFTPEGWMADESPMKREIYRMIEGRATTGIPNKIKNIIDVMRIRAYTPDFPPDEECIHLMNGTLYPDGRFEERKDKMVRRV